MNYKSIIRKKIFTSKEDLYKKIIELDFSNIKLSEYNKNYIQTKLNNLRGVLGLYGKLIYNVVSRSEISLKDYTLIDYGGGSGIMSLLASQIGIKNVIYNDIYDISCADVRNFSESLDLEISHIVCGDIEDLSKYVHENKILINGIVSYDVIEHIYDIKSYFEKLSLLSQKSFNISFGSGANIENPFFVHYVTKKQISFENEKRIEKIGHKKRDSLDSYLNIRKKIISDYSLKLNSIEINKIAKQTRGLMVNDIKKCVDEFMSKGYISYSIEHLTNTCDPLTGNWAEHLMDLKWLANLIRKNNFEVNIRPGVYEIHGNLLKKSIKFLLNLLIKSFGRRGMTFSPYYIVNGYLRKS